MLKKVFNWLHDTTISGDRISGTSAYHGIGSAGNEILGLANNSKPQFESLKAVFYMGIR
jgi:hypothetical protein